MHLQQDGIKDLLLYLQSADFVNQLDVGTKSFDSKGTGEVRNTWAGLISSVMTCVSYELGENRSCDKNASSLLRKCITVAEGRRRLSGNPTPFIRRAGKIFAHVLSVLQQEESSFTVDYVHVLRTNLLVVPEYCSRAKQSVFEDLMEFFANQLTRSRNETLSGEQKEEKYRSAAAFCLLIQNCPFDLSSNAVSGLLHVFSNIFRGMQEDGRTPTMIMSAMNNFIIRVGLDISSRMTELYESVEPYLLWALKGNARDSKLHEELIKYCLLQISANAVNKAQFEVLADVLERRISEMGSDRFIGGGAAERLEVKLPQRFLFELYGDVASKLRAGMEDDISNGEHLAKRARGEESRCSRIVSKFLSGGGCWGAALCIFLKNHGEAIPTSDLNEYVSGINNCLSESFSQGSMADIKTQANVLWLIRALQEIGHRAQGGAPIWGEVLNCLIYWLPAHVSDLRIVDECLLLFSVLISRRLVSASSLGKPFWTLNVFDFADVPTSAALELVGTVASLGMCDQILSGRTYEQYFDWVLRGLSYKHDDKISFYGRRANIISSSDLALSRVQSAFQNSLMAGSHQCWIEATQDRIWLEILDEPCEQFLYHTSRLRMLTEPYTCYKVVHRHELAGREDDEKNTVFANQISIDPDIHRIGAARIERALAETTKPEDAIRLCTVALGVIATSFAVGQASKSAPNAFWGSGGGSMMSKICSAIPGALKYDVNVLISAKSTSLDSLTLMATAIQRIQNAGGFDANIGHVSHEVVSSLRNLAKDVIKLIENAMRAKTPAANSRASHQFDDEDLDFDMPDVNERSHSSQRTTTSYGGSDLENSIAAGERTIRIILRCLESFLPLMRETSTRALSNLLLSAVPPDDAPPRGDCGIGISQDIAEAVIRSLGAPDTEFLLENIFPVLEAVARGQLNLDEHAGLTSSARSWLIRQIHCLSDGLRSLTSDPSEAIIPSNTFECVTRLVYDAAGIDEAGYPLALRSSSARASLAECILSLCRLNLDYFQPRLGPCLLQLMNDASYSVRICAGFSMASVLDLFEEADHIDIFEKNVIPNLVIKFRWLEPRKIEITPMGDIVDKELEFSSLHTIAAFGAASRILEPWCLFMLIYHGARQDVSVYECTVNAVKYMSTACGHDSIASFIAYHKRSIGYMWVQSRMPFTMLFKIPELLGLSSSATKRDVADHMKSCLIPAFIIEKELDELKLLASMCDSTLETILVSHWHLIEAYVIIFIVPHRGFALELLTAAGREEVHSEAVRLKILMEMFLLVSVPGLKPQDVPPPYKTPDEVTELLTSVFQGQQAILRVDLEACFQCMLHVHASIDKFVSSRHRPRALSSLRILIQWARGIVRVASTVRYACFMTLPYIGDETVGMDCLEILEDIIQSVCRILENQPNDKACAYQSTVKKMTMPIVLTLTSVIESQSTSTNQRQKAVAILEQFVEQAPSCIHLHLSILPPLPDLPQLGTVKSALQSKFQSPGIDVRFKALITTASSLPANIRKIALRSGGFEALQYKSTLVALCRSDVKSPIPEHVWQYARLVAQLGDKELFATAAELLSSLGPLRPNSIAFIPPVVQGTSGPILTALHPKVLAHLIDLLCSPSYAIVSAAADTIRRLLSVDVVQKTIKELPAFVEKAYLKPFVSNAKTGSVVPKVVPKPASPPMMSDLFATDDARLWIPNSTYDDWICTLTHHLMSMCDMSLLKIMQPLVRDGDVILADMVFPATILFFARAEKLSEASPNLRNALSRGIAMCLANRSAGPTSRRAAQTVLKALEELRQEYVNMCKNGYPKENMWKKAYWVDVDYLDVAQAANESNAPLMTMLLIEYWLEEKGGSVALHQVDPREHMSDNTPRYLSLLLDAQSKLSEPDGIYGLMRSNSLDLQLHLSEHEGQWDRALAGYDLLSGNMETKVDRLPILKSLRQLGCLHLLRAYSKSFSDDDLASPQLKDLQFEAAWRAGQWSLPSALVHSPEDASSTFNQSLYSSLRALDRGDSEFAMYETTRSRAELLHKAVNVGAESANVMNMTIMRMRMLDDVSDAARLWRHFSATNATSYEEAKLSLMNRWNARILENVPFKLVEPSLALQRVILQMAKLDEYLAYNLTRTSILARKDGHITEGVQAIRNMRMIASHSNRSSSLPGLITDNASPWRVEEAKLLWAEGKNESAIATVDSMLRLMKLEQPEGASTFHPDARYYELLCLLSKWQAISHTESSTTILDRLCNSVNGMTQTYAVDLENGHEKAKNKRLPDGSRRDRVLYTKDGVHPVTVLRLLSRCHYRLAQFSYSLYEQLEERIHSPEWARSEKIRRNNEYELSHLKGERGVKAADLQKRKKGSKIYNELYQEYCALNARCVPLERQVLNDREESARVYNEHSTSLVTALQGYRRSLEAGDWNSQATIFRTVALWFKHCGGAKILSTAKMITSVNDEVKKLIDRKAIPSSIYLELSHQIVSRLGTKRVDGNDFINILETLVFRLMQDHPHHVLYQIQALTRSGRVTVAGGFQAPNEKIAAAKRLLTKYAAQSANVRQFLSQMERMIEAYIYVAAHKLPARTEGAHQLPNNLKKRTLSDLTQIPVLTAPLPVDPKCKYPPGSFPYFSHFEEKISLVGGINEPKLLRCVGSDGRIYKQLAKSGNDDLRQDAVIQQLFGFVNTLLKQCQSTNVRNLNIRTYKVIPFSPEAGLLEWVDGTVLLSTYLVGKHGAHERYRPHDMKSADISVMLKDAPASNLDQLYKEACENFHPVMHNFFLEHYHEPGNWYEKRVAYTRSCAVNSIVGYIIGLGDRHSSNILIDKGTAEFVHIDFGITFEQGLTLRTPERVPFRLTRDIVDGMGACGVEGIMRRCCEETMQVLRSNREALTTIIAVLVHDPILKWAVAEKHRQIDPSAANRSTADVNFPAEQAAAEPQQHLSDGNLDAERALMRVKQKLEGYEVGELRSIHGQVQQLIHAARDPARLARMYAGWAAWL